MNEIEVLMVLPKAAVSSAAKGKEHWNIEHKASTVTIYENEQPIGKARWENSMEFGMERPALYAKLYGLEDDLLIFEAMISRLALEYRQIRSRHPLYIRLKDSEISLIAKASRMGFLPYMGQWQNADSELSVKHWEAITEQLRQAYPKGLDA
ncbi:MAG: hypothetical protein HUJ54_01390 [Erysipelotrichaceae bacterium]|nr:hypothetical protein [Erysipelotrichaceae bacterium]